jgi:ectoine hydroxylase-related dioxygenase (phytanoyl-CoA dioxygenase family)
VDRREPRLIVKTDRGVEQVVLEPGEAVMTPELEHSGGVNKTGAIRYGVYFRVLEDDAAQP